MKLQSSVFPLLLIIFISGCTSTKVVYPDNTSKKNVISEAKVFLAAYQQTAAEYKALCYQAYNMAQLQLDQFLLEETPLPKAIMTDIDETLLDNSLYQVHQASQGLDYDPPSWYDWTARAQADTVPGALKFFQYAASKGVEIFYVTNREEVERAATVANLKKFNFPFADNAHLMLKTSTSSKQPRRDSINMRYSIIMQIGDNLNDLNMLFEKASVDSRWETADQLRPQFGNRLIVLPNPSYGEWEQAIYKYYYELTPEQKDSMLRKLLKNY